jgi:hypothetical protein
LPLPHPLAPQVRRAAFEEIVVPCSLALRTAARDLGNVAADSVGLTA